MADMTVNYEMLSRVWRGVVQIPEGVWMIDDDTMVVSVEFTCWPFYSDTLGDNKGAPISWRYPMVTTKTKSGVWGKAAKTHYSHAQRPESVTKAAEDSIETGLRAWLDDFAARRTTKA